MSAESQAERLSYTRFMAHQICRGDSLIKRRGPDGAVNRAHFLLQVQDYIKRIAPNNLPDIANSLRQEHLFFVVPRLYDMLLKKEGENIQKADHRLLQTYKQWKEIPDADPFDFSALLAGQAGKKRSERRQALSILLDRDRWWESMENNIGNEYELQLWCIANQTPDLWKEYRRVSPDEKFRHRITDIYIPAMVSVYWEGKFEQYVLPTEDERVMMSMDKNAVEAMLLYKYPEKGSPDLIDRLNVQVHKHISSLRG